jgi:hypothetical protein
LESSLFSDAKCVVRATTRDCLGWLIGDRQHCHSQVQFFSVHSFPFSHGAYDEPSAYAKLGSIYNKHTQQSSADYQQRKNSHFDVSKRHCAKTDPVLDAQFGKKLRFHFLLSCSKFSQNLAGARNCSSKLGFGLLANCSGARTLKITRSLYFLRFFPFSLRIFLT